MAFASQNGALPVPVVSVAFRVASLMPPLPFRRGSSAVDLMPDKIVPRITTADSSEVVSAACPPTPTEEWLPLPETEHLAEGSQQQQQQQQQQTTLTIDDGTTECRNAAATELTATTPSAEEMTRRPTGTEGDE